MPVRRHAALVAAPRYNSYSNVRHDYSIDDSLQRADYLSNAVLEDTYEAATRSRGRDHELLRNVNAAIRPSSSSRDSTPTRTGRQTSRLRSLPPVDIKSAAGSRAVVPYRNIAKIKSALSEAPPPASLLSSRIESYLRGSSLPPKPLSRDIANSISYSSLLSRSASPKELRSYASPYREYPPEPTRSYTRSISPASYRSPSPYVSRTDADYDYAGSDGDEDYEPESYRRKYKIVKTPVGVGYGSGVRRLGDSGSSVYRDHSSDGSDDDEYYDADESFGTYTCPRPPGTSPNKLSTYDGGYDGTYEADMAEMYDYVPFGPSRHGILELTPEDNSNLPLSSYSSQLSVLPRLSPPRSHVSLISPHPTRLDDSRPSPTASRQILDSLVSSTAARAKAVLANSRLPEYRNASLVLSVEGSAVSEDGRNRYGFRYYPPPIPLKGSHIGIDERILSISPKPVSPADSFLSTYLNRLRDIRTDLRDHVSRGDYGRGGVSLAPVTRPSYDHRTVSLPVHFSGKAHSVPVSSYRSRLGNGQSHRVDVFPLVVSETALPSDKKLHLPVYKAGGDSSSGGSSTKLTVLEKINIKVSTEQHISPRAASIARRVRASTAPPVSRPLPGQNVQQQQYIKVAAPLLATQAPPGPVYVMLVPNSSVSRFNHNIFASKPVVLSQGETPWSVRARAASVPPQDLRSLRGTSLPPRPRKSTAPAYKPPEPLPSTKLWAHSPVRPDLLRSARARSVEPLRRASYHEPSFQEPLPSSTLWAHRPRVLRSDAPRLARIRSENRQSYPGSLYRAASEPRAYDRASDYYYSIPEVKERALSRYLYAVRGKYGPDSKPPRPSLGNFPQVYVPWNGPGPSNRSKAAIIGSRLETDSAKRPRRPRSEFAANKLRELKRDEIEEGIYYRTPGTGTLQSSRPPLYRVESRLSPDDIIYEPSSFIRMRERVKDVQEKMDRQRQLLDRYLNSDFKIAPSSSQNVEGRSSVKIPAYYAAGGDPDNRPVSDLRRRLRRTLAKTKNSPDYFKE